MFGWKLTKHNLTSPDILCHTQFTWLVHTVQEDKHTLAAKETPTE